MYGIVILITFRDYGINPDEENHLHYGFSVINWYFSGLQDRRMFSTTNTWLYGGFFDSLSFLAGLVLPLNDFDARHLCTSFMGMLGVVAAYRIGCLFGSKWMGVLAALFLILTPRFYGHVFNNHKDIPFAVLYLWSIYWQLKVLRAMPQAPWSWTIATGIITGMAMGIRVGGIMLLGFAGIFWFAKCVKTDAKRCILQWCTTFVVAYIVMLLFWPWAQLKPLSHPWQALTAFSKFAHVSTDMLFEGQYLRINEIPWYYAPKWLILALPEFVLLGLITGIVAALLHWRTANYSQILNIALLTTSSLAPLLYVVGSNTPLYDGVRHILFIILPLVVLSALGIYTLAQKENRLRLVTLGFVGGLMLMTLWEMIILHPNQYVYFNRIFAGGIERASNNYVTDYWNNSYKQGTNWLSEQASVQKDRKIQVYSFPASTSLMLDSDRFEMVTNPWNADYILTTTRYDQHRVVSGEVLHTIKARTVPLLYIIRPDQAHSNDALFAGENVHRLLYLGVLYQINGQKENAEKTFEKGLQLDPENTTIHINLGELLLDANEPAKAALHFQKAYDYIYNNARYIHKMGVCFEQMNQPEEAKKSYTRALELNPYFNPARRALGDLLKSENRYSEALSHYEKIVEVFPESLGDWHRIGVVRHKLGDFEGAAQAWKNLVSQDPTQTEVWLNIAFMLYEQGKLDESLEIYDQVRSSHPDNHKAFFMSGKVMLEQKKWDQTIDMLTKQIQRDSLATNSWLLIAKAYRHKGDINRAQQALAKYILAHNHRLDGWREYFELGKIYQARGDIETARIIYQAASRVLPDNHELQDSLRILSNPHLAK